MTRKARGADLLARSVVEAGVEQLFTLSGNQIMPVFDACIDLDIDLIHVRHEAAAVHMADAWGRLTGRPGVAMVTAGPGLANCPSALYVARMAESPLVLLSGSAPVGHSGRGAFQEMAQAKMVGHVAKASWQVEEARHLSRDFRHAFDIARRGRPGPVHLSLPFDLLEAKVEAPKAEGRVQPAARRLKAEVADYFMDVLAAAEKPLMVAGPGAMRGKARTSLLSVSQITHVPFIGMESPRGVNDPSLGAVSEMLSQADAVLLIGKKLDFTLQSNGTLIFGADAQLLQLDPDMEVLELTKRVSHGSRVVPSEIADPVRAAGTLERLAAKRSWPTTSWPDEVSAALRYRPKDWQSTASAQGEPLHAVEVCRVVNDALSDDKDAVFISDGGEFGQWAQACISAPHRVINGPSGAIGSALPFAIAARLAFPESRVAALLGDGTFGFHALEFDTAVRSGLPFVAVVGNDATWNAEYQIQLRKYGPERTVGCELLPSRYDDLVRSLGGHGENVSSRAELAPAIERAQKSGLPACVNVAIQRAAAPVIRRG